MENKNHEDIIKMQSDVEHIKQTTDKIESTVSELLKAIFEHKNELVDIRGRVRELEHDVINLRGLVWKLFGAIATGGGAYGIFEIFGK